MTNILFSLIWLSVLWRYWYHNMHTNMWYHTIWSKPTIICNHQEWTLDLEYASDDQTRIQGLMHRTSLWSMSGMLFVRSGDDMRSFWMKNTLIPLDMIFIDSQWSIKHIHQSAKPWDLTPISSEAPVSYVLEVNEWRTQTHQITTGCKMKNI